MSTRELDIASLAAGGDGVARDEGRVTFVPRTAPGDRVRVQLVKTTSSFARGKLLEILTPSPARVSPPCPAFTRGCGGCAWQHVARAEQLAAKHANVAGQLRKLVGLTLHPIAAPAPALGWRRRARFHAWGRQLGLYAEGSNDLVPLSSCPQLEPALDAVLAVIAAAGPPDGEVALAIGHTGAVVVGIEAGWPAAAALVGVAGIVGVQTGGVPSSRARASRGPSPLVVFGDSQIEIEAGLFGGPWDFAQASAAGNAALIELARGALGSAKDARLLELYAGSGNLTRGFVADGWRVLATDIAGSPVARDSVEFRAGPVADMLRTIVDENRSAFAAVVLDPPRTGAADAIAGILEIAPQVIVYVSCDAATLARDANQLVAAGYRATDAWPIDLMPQTAHVEVVLRLERSPRG